MKHHLKIVALIALALMLTLAACARSASRATVNTPTNAGEPSFPFETQDTVSQFATQTAFVSTPQIPVLPTSTGEVQIETPVPAQPESGGGEVANTPTTDQNSGGGVATLPAPTLGPTPVVERPSSYTLQRGEWPICIARRFNLDLSSFFAANGLNMNSKPSAGTTLTIPQSGAWGPQFGSRSLLPHPTSYTVTAGDSVNSIACKFGDVTPEAILNANNLTSGAELQPGTTITIP